MSWNLKQDGQSKSEEALGRRKPLEDITNSLCPPSPSPSLAASLAGNRSLQRRSSAPPGSLGVLAIDNGHDDDDDSYADDAVNNRKRPELFSNIPEMKTQTNTRTTNDPSLLPTPKSLRVPGPTLRRSVSASLVSERRRETRAKFVGIDYQSPRYLGKDKIKNNKNSKCSSSSTNLSAKLSAPIIKLVPPS